MNLVGATLKTAFPPVAPVVQRPTRQPAYEGGVRILPSDLTNGQLWLRADSGDLEDAHTGGSPVTDGGSVGLWPDGFSTGNNATQATSLKRPTWHRGVLNNRPIVRFDGTDDFLSTTLTALTSAATIFAVAQASSSASVVIGTRVVNDRTYVAAGDSAMVAGGVGNHSWLTVAGSTSWTSWRSVVLRYDGAQVDLWNSLTNEYSAAQVGSIVNANTYHVGANNKAGSDANRLTGDIAEIIVYAGAKPDAEILALQYGYLMPKYNLKE